MHNRLVKMVAVVLAGVMLLTVPGMVGCGEDGGGGRPEIVIGFLGDLSGPGAFAVAQTFEGMRDYIVMADETGMVPEVKMRFLTYDSRGDRGRVQPGYKWLKGQGANLISTISGNEAEIIESSLAADKIPDFSSQSALALKGSQWAWGMLPPPWAQGQAIAHWIEETWAGQEPAKIGFVGMGPLLNSREEREAIEEWCETSAKLEFIKAEMVPYGTVSWAAEIAHLKGCDFIVDSCIGPSMATFERDIRLSGYNGQLVGNMESYIAFWDLARAVIPPADLAGTVCSDPYATWTDDVPFINEIKEWNSHFLSPDEVAEVLRTCGRIGGWCNGTILVEAMKLAVAAVGAENVDGQAMADGLRAVDITVEGFGNTWKLGDHPSFLQTVIMRKWDVQIEDWVGLGEWYRPPIMEG